MIKRFDSEMIFFGLDWEEITSYGQKHFRETNNRLCVKHCVSRNFIPCPSNPT